MIFKTWRSMRQAFVLTVFCAAPWCSAQQQGVLVPLDGLVRPVLPTVIELNEQTQKLPLTGYARVWVDDSGQASVQRAQEMFRTQPESENIHQRQDGRSYRLHDKAMWLHFSASNLKPSAHWRLQVDLPTTDLASLYYQRPDGSWVQQQAGDSLPHSRWALRDRYPLLALSEEAGRPVEYLLRIAHARVPYSAPINITNDEAVIGARQVENLFMGAYFGMSFAVVVICMAWGIALRYANYLRYAIYVGMLGVAQLGFLGLGTQYITPEWTHWNGVASFVLPAASVVAGLWFIGALLNPAQHSPWLHRWAVLLMLGLSLVAVVDAIWPSRPGFAMINICTALSLATLYAMIWRSHRVGDRNAVWVALGFSPVIVAALITVLRNFGVLGTTFLSQYGVTIASALEVPILMYALMRRSATQRDMRVREQALLSRDMLTGLADERRLLAKLHGALLRARRYQHRLGVLHVQLSNHAELTREHSTQTADTALLLTASHLRAVSRDIDMPARLEGPNFVLLIEGPTTGPKVIEMATHILARSLRPSDALPVGQLPKLRISAALLPDEVADTVGEDASTCLNWLLTEIEGHGDVSKAIRAVNF